MKRKSLLNREKLLTKQKLEIIKVEFDDNDFVCVREMTGRERDQFEKTLYEMKGEGKDFEMERKLDDFRAKLAVHTLCDEAGELLLESGDYETLSTSMSGRRLDQIATAAQKLNKITEEDKEELVKNSGAGGTGVSNSDSAKN